MIYTSYFAMLKKIPENFVTISICAKAPSFYKGLEYKVLAPKYGFFQEWKKTHDNDYYIEQYKLEVTDKLDALEVVNALTKLSNGLDIVLLCYEKPSDFCHRHLVEKWLKENGIECTELTF